MSLEDDSIVGDLINFRGLVYAPLNENGVVFLFGKVMEDLNMYIEEIKPGFPDCIARRFVGKGWKRIRIEFEFKSKNFQNHKHNPNGCDVIVCWEHDWEDCPIEVIELKDVIKGLENRPIEKPEITVIDLLGVSQDLKTLLSELFNYIRTLSEDIVIKEIKTGYTIYSPQRVFIYVWFRKDYLKLLLFTRGEEINGVEPARTETDQFQKWGYINIEGVEDIEKSKTILKKSFDLIREAIARNEPTGHHAVLDTE